MLQNALLAGFLLGLRHALEADHIAAIGSFRQRSISFAVSRGLLWSAGHTLTILAFAVFTYSFGGSQLPLLTPLFEFFVGVMLIALGLGSVVRARRPLVHEHSHSHASGKRHKHRHVHLTGADEHRSIHHVLASSEGRKVISIGMIHGLAGSAAVTMIAAHSVGQSYLLTVLFVLLFGVGAALAMSLFSVVLNISLTRISSPRPKVMPLVYATIGIATCCLGLVVAYRNIDELFAII